MLKNSGVTFVALNLPDEFSAFFKSLEIPGCHFMDVGSPEEIVPTLKDDEKFFVVLINGNALENEGHNEIVKFQEILKIDPYLSISPVIAITSFDEKFQHKVLKLGFVSQVLPIDTDIETAGLLVQNVISIFQSRRKLEMQVAINQDEERAAEFQQLEEIDKITGIFGREAFCRRTETMLKNNPDKKYVIVRWDLDRFKVFNDTYGVKAGDEYLRYIGKEYINRKWQSMTYGHWVADHFVMCIEETLFSGPAIYHYITSVVQKFKPEYEFVVRMGIFRIDDPTLSVRLMCDRALLAINSLKTNFEQRIAYYDDSMRDHLLEEQELINRMENALLNKEFIVFYQPQYNFASGKMTGAEALVRWQHPEKGMIPPDKFIPIFEQNGFITRLDEYVWETVCHQMREWIDSGIEVVPVSVNISRRDIYNPKLCSVITSVAEKYKIDSTLLRLEITESAYMEDPNQLIKVVDKLKSVGFTVEMDDFGSGYSSLNTLKDVPVDILKLDLKFLASEGSNTRGGSILTSVVRMANWLKMPVIAEGIETKDQAEFLKSIGCSLMQGFLFSRPIPVGEFEELMDASDLELVEDDDISESLQNAVDFMNISTQNALLFNSFVGGAAIIERSGDKLENIRLNDQFFESIGVSREEYGSRIDDPLCGFSPDEAKKFLNMLDEAKETGKESLCENYSFAIDDKHEPYWTRNRARYLASTGGRDLFYVATDNITQQMNLYNKNEELLSELSLLMDSVPCGIIKYEQIGAKRVVKYVNQYAANIFDRDVGEFVDKFKLGDDGLILDEDIKKLEEIKAKALKNCSESYASWFRVIKKNGALGRMYLETKITYGVVSKSSKKKINTFTVILVDLTRQGDIDVEKFGGVLKSIFDEIFEVDYEANKFKLIHTNNPYLNDKFKEFDTISDGMVPWIKNVVVDKYRKEVAKILDLEYIKSIRANNKTPIFEYEVISDGVQRRLMTTLLKIGDSKYLVCSRRQDNHYEQTEANGES